MTHRDPRVRSEIPPAHPHKAAIEERFSRLVEILGHSWGVSILAEPRSNLGVCLWQTFKGRRARFWSTSLSPDQQTPATLEEWLRAFGERLQIELNLTIGYRVVGGLTFGRRAELRDLIKRRGGGLMLDGTIVVPGEERASFLVGAEALFVTLEVALVPPRRKQVYPVNRVRRDLP